MTTLLVIVMAAISVWLVVALRRGSRRYGDATGDFSRALSAIAPRGSARRRRR